MPGDELGKTVRVRYIRFLRRPVDGLTEKQHQRRHGGKGTDERTNDTLGQHDPHVCTNLKAHETEHQQSYYRRQRGREDRRCGFLNRIISGDTGRITVCVFVLLLTVTVE